MSSTAQNDLVALLEQKVIELLESSDAKTSDRLKAAEVGLKLLAIKHRTEKGNKDDTFFD